MKVCIVSFSGRRDGNCSRIANVINEKERDAGIYDFSALSVTPCGKCDYECFNKEKSCPYIGDAEADVCEAIVDSDIAYFIVPNYCDYPCSNFFAFNERQCALQFQYRGDFLNRYLAVRKKFIVVSNTNQDNFIAAFKYHIPEGSEPDILFLSAKKFGKISLKGDLTDSDKVKEAILRFME